MAPLPALEREPKELIQTESPSHSAGPDPNVLSPKGWERRGVTGYRAWVAPVELRLTWPQVNTITGGQEGEK